VRKGRLISFEGLDGAGKTTQVEMLGRWLDAHGVSHIRTCEPGGSSLGSKIRQLLFHDPELAITPLAEAFLFQADRAQHFATKILPALDAGTLVISDRCFDSSIAYQGVARGVGTECVEQLSLLATQGYVPDLTILLDLEPIQVQARTALTHERAARSRFDSETEQFHRTLREAFLALAKAHPERIKVIDAVQSPQCVHEQIVKLVEQLLQQ
jgi:dTMP kinase